ncbi:9193_t:CDS:2, partial [Dentiscutata erythropus]
MGSLSGALSGTLPGTLCGKLSDTLCGSLSVGTLTVILYRNCIAITAATAEQLQISPNYTNYTGASIPPRKHSTLHKCLYIPPKITLRNNIMEIIVIGSILKIAVEEDGWKSIVKKVFVLGSSDIQLNNSERIDLQSEGIRRLLRSLNLVSSLDLTRYDIRNMNDLRLLSQVKSKLLNYTREFPSLKLSRGTCTWTEFKPYARRHFRAFKDYLREQNPPIDAPAKM